MKHSPSTGPPSRPARAKGLTLLAGVALGLLAFGAAWKWWAGRATDGSAPAVAEAADPRLTYPTPYRNVRPDVSYVGDAACAECHADRAETYREHPMGRSLVPVAQATPIEHYEPAARNPFTASALHYAVTRRDGRPVHHEWAAGPDGKVLAETAAEVQFAVGSGTRVRNYAVDRDGYLYLSPVTWYPESGRWDLAPSFDKYNQHFGRQMVPGCLFCHSNYAEHVPDTVNRYREPIFRGHAIGCERCHGPGELHVKRRGDGDMAGGPDDTIVNPARLDHALREDVCNQCHLLAQERVLCRGRSHFEYRPGLPLPLFLLDFMDGRAGGSDFKLVSAVPQLRTSRCYKESRGPNKLGCVSCHDPHRLPAPEERVAHYRGRCLQCHTEASCSLPAGVRREKQKDDSCVACHMPRTGTEVDHTSVTDHRIRRRADGPAEPPVRQVPGPSDLVLFEGERIGLESDAARRGLGLVLMAILNRRMPAEVERQFAEKALPLLDAALKADPQDWPVARARGEALWCLGNREEALAALEAVLAARPESEMTLHGAASIALEMDRLEEARGFFERAARVNPWQRPYRQGLAVISFRLGEWDRSARECRESLRLEPTNTAARSLLIQCYLCLGQKDQAQAEFEVLRQLTAENRRPALRSWYEEQIRRLAP
jgi:Flp pilus assembly protein TadD